MLGEVGSQPLAGDALENYAGPVNVDLVIVSTGSLFEKNRDTRRIPKLSRVG